MKTLEVLRALQAETGRHIFNYFIDEPPITASIRSGGLSTDQLSPSPLSPAFVATAPRS